MSSKYLCEYRNDKFSQWYVDNLKHMIDTYSYLNYDKFEVITEDRS